MSADNTNVGRYATASIPWRGAMPCRQCTPHDSRTLDGLPPSVPTSQAGRQTVQATRPTQNSVMICANPHRASTQSKAHPSAFSPIRRATYFTTLRPIRATRRGRRLAVARRTWHRIESRCVTLHVTKADGGFPKDKKEAAMTDVRSIGAISPSARPPCLVAQPHAHAHIHIHARTHSSGPPRPRYHPCTSVDPFRPAARPFAATPPPSSLARQGWFPSRRIAVFGGDGGCVTSAVR